MINDAERNSIKKYFKDNLNIDNLEFEIIKNNKFINLYSDEINLNDVQPSIDDLRFIEKTFLNAEFQGIKNIQANSILISNLNNNYFSIFSNCI